MLEVAHPYVADEGQANLKIAARRTQASAVQKFPLTQYLNQFPLLHNQLTIQTNNYCVVVVVSHLVFLFCGALFCRYTLFSIFAHSAVDCI